MIEEKSPQYQKFLEYWKLKYHNFEGFTGNQFAFVNTMLNCNTFGVTSEFVQETLSFKKSNGN